MENKIKNKIKIADLSENKRKYELSKEYRKSLNSYDEQFGQFKKNYNYLKGREPLKSKIETLKKVFSFNEKNYNAESPGPTDEEIELVRELCEYCKIDYYKTPEIDNN